MQCVVSAETAARERLAPGGFPAAPADASGAGHWRVASVKPDGTFSWSDVGIAQPGEQITMVNGQPYRAHDWSLLLTTEGTRLSHKTTTHGMNISIDWTTVTPY